MYTKFGNGDLLPHDWALVVLGEQEPVEIYDCSNSNCRFITKKDSILFWMLFAAGFILLFIIICCIFMRCQDPSDRSDVGDNFQRTE